MGYINPGRAILSGVLSGIGAGGEAANNTLIEKRKAAAKALEDANQQSNLEREFNFIEGLPTPEEKNRAVAIKTAGGMSAGKTGEVYSKVYKASNGDGKSDKPNESEKNQRGYELANIVGGGNATESEFNEYQKHLNSADPDKKGKLKATEGMAKKNRKTKQ